MVFGYLFLKWILITVCFLIFDDFLEPTSSKKLARRKSFRLAASETTLQRNLRLGVESTCDHFMVKICCPSCVCPTQKVPSCRSSENNMGCDRDGWACARCTASKPTTLMTARKPRGTRTTLVKAAALKNSLWSVFAPKASKNWFVAKARNNLQRQSLWTSGHPTRSIRPNNKCLKLKQGRKWRTWAAR